MLQSCKMLSCVNLEEDKYHPYLAHTHSYLWTLLHLGCCQLPENLRGSSSKKLCWHRPGLSGILEVLRPWNHSLSTITCSSVGGSLVAMVTWFRLSGVCCIGSTLQTCSTSTRFSDTSGNNPSNLSNFTIPNFLSTVGTTASMLSALGISAHRI